MTVGLPKRLDVKCFGAYGAGEAFETRAIMRMASFKHPGNDAPVEVINSISNAIISGYPPLNALTTSLTIERAFRVQLMQHSRLCVCTLGVSITRSSISEACVLSFGLVVHASSH